MKSSPQFKHNLQKSLISVILKKKTKLKRTISSNISAHRYQMVMNLVMEWYYLTISIKGKNLQITFKSLNNKCNQLKIHQNLVKTKIKFIHLIKILLTHAYKLQILRIKMVGKNEGWNLKGILNRWIVSLKTPFHFWTKRYIESKKIITQTSLITSR